MSLRLATRKSVRSSAPIAATMSAGGGRNILPGAARGVDADAYGFGAAVEPPEVAVGGVRLRAHEEGVELALGDHAYTSGGDAAIQYKQPYASDVARGGDEAGRVADVHELCRALAPGGVMHGCRARKPGLGDLVERLLRGSFKHRLHQRKGRRVVKEFRVRRRVKAQVFVQTRIHLHQVADRDRSLLLRRCLGPARADVSRNGS